MYMKNIKIDSINTGCDGKWKSNRIRKWSEIYPQLVIYFQDILVKYL
jgi:hypothetical protein